MKYHERNGNESFIISLSIVAVIAALVISVPTAQFQLLLGIVKSVFS